MSQIEEPDLAHYVVRRASLSVHLLHSLRADLQGLGLTDLLPVVDIITGHASEAAAACQEVMDRRRQENRLRMLVDLQQLSRLGGPTARRLVNRLATSLAPSSGCHRAYVVDGSGGLQGDRS